MFEKEIDARQLIYSRQQEYIFQLQDEIKNAKMILQNRNMRNKFFDKLKDYKDESEKLKDFEAKGFNMPSTKESKPLSSKNRMRSGSRSTHDNNMIDMIVKQTHSNNSCQVPIFTRKVSIRSSNYFEIPSRSYTPNIF